MPELVAGRYQVLNELAQGGIGVVYRALDKSTGREVALKCLLDSALARPRVCAMFEREYHTLARLKHPRIVEVFDFGIAEGRPYYTMELLDGADLGDLAPIPYRKACGYLRDVASSLALLHTRRRLHRDLSARNVRLTSDDRCKLLDFGAMADFGIPEEAVGTPPLVPPEALRGMSLDQRADIYALGALAYRILSKQHAYKARALEELPQVWRKPPVRLPALVPEIPAALDELVMSMLSLDAMLRPASMSEVIDRLTAIADLPPDTDRVREVESYLLRPKLTGRTRALDTIERRIARAHTGSGSTLLIEGNPGVGKSRLLDEAALQAQLSGALAIRVDARADSSPNALAHAIARALLHAAPESARAAAVSHAQILGRVVPELLDGVQGPGPYQRVQPPMDARAFRPHLQSAFLSWLLELSAQHTLVVLVDDLHKADEPSAALLTALAQSVERKRILLICTRWLAPAAVAQEAVTAISTDARRVRIHRLRRSDTHELLVSMFGDVPNAEELSNWVHDISTGSPAQIMEIVRHLVDTNVVRYSDAMWVLPLMVGSEALPPSLTATMRARAASFSPAERALAETLSVRRGEITLPLCFALLPEQTSAEVLGTLDDLVGNGTLVAAFDSYEFAQDALREALVQELSPERARTLHRRMADALLALYPDQPEQVVEAGWHLLRGGDDRRGADMLAQTAPRLATRGVATFSGLPALEAALALYEQQGRSPRECLTLRAVIVSSADRPAVMKYGESTLQQLYHYAGGPILARTSPWLGGRLAGALALVVMAVRRWLTPKSRRGPRALVAMGMFFRCAYSALIVRSATMDVAGMTRVATQMRAFSDSSRIGLITSLIFRGTLDAMRGRVGAARKTLQAARTLAGTDQEWQPDPASRRGILSAIYTPLGMLEAQHSPFGKRALDRIEEIAALGVDPSVLEPGRIEISNEGGVTAPELSMAVHQIRMMYHLARGERSLADQRIGKLRAATVQTGLSMQYDIFRLLSELGLAALTLDVAGLRRAHEMLLHYVKSYPHLSPFVALAQAYVKLSLRDDEGRAELAAWTARHKPGEISGWEGAYLSYMMLLLDAGESALARELAERALASDAMKDDYLTSTRATFEVLVARCQAEMGDVSQGRQRLARLMQDLEGADQSLTLGFVHEQAAYVAAASGDREACRDHLDRMKRWFAATRNPSLLMRAQTVIERLTKGSEPDWESDARTELRTLRRPKRRPKVDDVRAIFEGCQSLDERAARALHLIVEQTGGLSGHIYLVRDGKLQRMASLGEPNDDEIDRVLQDQFETASTNVDPSSPVETTSSEGGMVAAIEDRRGPEDHYATLMLGTLERDKTPLGAVRVRVSGGQLRPIAAAFLGAITHELAIDD